MPVLFASYTIKIAVYKDEVNLMRFIAKIHEPKYRKNIRIKEKNHLHYVTSVPYLYEQEVNKALKAYKEVFPDAFVEEIATFSETNSTMVIVSNVVEHKEPSPLEAKKLLANKTVYVCSPNYAKERNNAVVKLAFKETALLYSKLRRDIPPIELPYTFDKENISVTMSGIQFRYKIEKEEAEFLLVQSFVNDKKRDHLRYYFDENLALECAKGY